MELKIVSACKQSVLIRADNVVEHCSSLAVLALEEISLAEERSGIRPVAGLVSVP